MSKVAFSICSIYVQAKFLFVPINTAHKGVHKGEAAGTSLLLKLQKGVT